MTGKASIRGNSALAVTRFAGLAVVAGLLVGAGPARAEPTLQLYIEGAEYDAGTETWTLSVDPIESDEFSFRLWTVGYVGTQNYMIQDVRLAAAYSREHAGDLGITLSPALAFEDGYVPGPGTQLDVAVPMAPVQNGVGVGLPYPWRSFVRTEVDNDYVDATVGDGLSSDGEVLNGGVPVLGVVADPKGGLASHGLYGPETVWKEFALGNFDQFDDLVGDLVDGFDPESFTKSGQINAYDVTVSGAMGATVSFDLYNTVQTQQ